MMVESTPTGTRLVARAQRLVTISLIAPFVIYLAIIPTLAIRGQPNPYGPNTVLIAVICFAVAFGIAGIWIYRGIHDKPSAWQSGGCSYGALLAFYFLPMAFELKDDLRIEFADAAYAVAVVVVNIGIVLVGWLPARRAARLVLGDLMSDEVVGSALTVTFKARGKRIALLRVMPETLAVEVRPNSGKFTTKRSYPLTDVVAVSVRTETRDSEYAVPGAEGKKPIEVTRGDVVVIELSDGELVFPAKGDVQRVTRFVEERCRAVVGRG